MVYYKPRRQRQRKSDPNNLSRMPEEMLMQTLKHVDTPSILNVRKSDRNFVGVCNEILSQELSTLYIHPSGGLNNLNQALRICKHPVFRRGIKEVVILGIVPWKEIEQIVPSIRNPEAVYHITAQSLKGRFATWPIMPFVTNRNAAIRNKKQHLPRGRREDLPPSFEVEYDQLLLAISDLPQLEDVSFAQEVRGPGWNQPRSNQILEHMSKCAVEVSSWDQQLRYPDVDALFHILGAIGSRATTLRLDTELPLAGPVVQALQQLWAGPQLDKTSPLIHLANIKSITRLDLTLCIGTRDTKHALAGALIACTAEKLKHLKLTLVPQHARSQMATVYDDLDLLSIGSILSFGSSDAGYPRNRDCYFKALKSLTLVYQDTPPSAKCKDSRRRVRPTAQDLEVNILLWEARNTLRLVTIHNIIFPTFESPNLGNPKNMNLGVHEATTARTEFPELEHFEWRINRFTHDPRCRADESETHRDCEKHLCGRYLDNPQCTLEQYEALATTLGATLEAEEDAEDYGSWDFGAAAMRARATAQQDARE